MALGGTSVSAAEEVGPPAQFVDELTSAVRSNLAQARLPDGSNVPAETAEELKLPIVPRSLEVQTIDRALLSAAMEICEVDYAENSFLPYMQTLRASGQYSQKQMAYVGMLHGFSMAVLGNDLDSSMCSDALTDDMIREGTTAPIKTP